MVRNLDEDTSHSSTMYVLHWDRQLYDACNVSNLHNWHSILLSFMCHKITAVTIFVALYIRGISKGDEAALKC